MKMKLIEELNNKGKKLTPEQSFFFRKSKVRDNSGNLFVCYRNSTMVNSRSSFSGNVKWFTINKDYADKYGVTGNNETYECYLNCKNIFDCGNTDGRLFNLDPRELKLSSEFIKIIKRLNLTEQLFVKIFEDEIKSFESGYKMKIFSIVRTDKFIDLVKRSGYDCVKTIEEERNICYGAFYDRDIKLITNENPTDSDNINESTDKENSKVKNKIINEATPFTIPKELTGIDKGEVDLKKIAGEADKVAKEKAADEEGEDILYQLTFDGTWDELDTEEKLGKLFNLLVPDSGKADTTAGELVRAMNRLIYRDYNDGDSFYEGYGLETCAPAAAFIYENIEKASDFIDDILYQVNNLTYNDKEYTSDLLELADIVIDHIFNNPRLVADDNTLDMFDSDTSYFEEMSPKYEFEAEVNDYNLEKLIDAEKIDWSDVEDWLDSIVNYDLGSGQVERRALDWYVITELNLEDYNTLEDRYYKWLEEWVDSLIDEYGDPDEWDEMDDDEEEDDDLDEDLDNEDLDIEDQESLNKEFDHDDITSIYKEFDLDIEV